MVKQKFVVKLSLDTAKKRSKALSTVATMNGIQSVALEGDKLVAVGDGTDAVTLTTQLRKKLGSADLISVISGDESKESKTQQPQVYPYQYSYSYPSMFHHEGSYDHYKRYSLF